MSPNSRGNWFELLFIITESICFGRLSPAVILARTFSSMAAHEIAIRYEGHDWIWREPPFFSRANRIDWVQFGAAIGQQSLHSAEVAWTSFSVFRFTTIQPREQRKLPIKIEFGRESIAIMASLTAPAIIKIDTEIMFTIKIIVKKWFDRRTAFKIAKSK